MRDSWLNKGTPRGPRPGAEEKRLFRAIGRAEGLVELQKKLYGLAAAKWQQRAKVLRAAYAAHPERFPRGVPVPPPLRTAAWINKPAPVPVLAGPEGAGS